MRTNVERNVMQSLRKFWLLIIAYFKPPTGRAISKVAQATKPDSKVAQATEPDEYGEFYFRDTILDQLDRYFIILKRMKRGDKSAYNLYSQIGAHILPERNEGYSRKALEPRWLELRPSFGMVLYGSRSEAAKIDKERKRLVPFAIYFHKFNPSKAPVSVQPISSGDIYVCTVYWDTLHPDRASIKARFNGAPTEFAINISPSGDVRLLKVLFNKSITIRATKGRDRGSTFTVPQREWGIHDFFKEWAQQNTIDVQLFLTSLFIQTANTQIAAAEAMIKVRAAKGRMAAVFSVNILRTPYFFKDRDLSVGPSGKKKRIFHIVRTHTRKTGSVVRTHFRGVQEFNWNGYKIRITVPGWHHVNTNEINIGAIDEEHMENIKDYINTAALGKTLKELEEDSVGGVKR
jgi:hypothetical protein